jgi:hypothetical protein
MRSVPTDCPRAEPPASIAHPPVRRDLSRTRGVVESVSSDLIAIRLEDRTLFTYALVGELDCSSGPGFTAATRFAGLQPGDVVAVTTCDAPDDLRAALRRRAAG